MTLTHAYAYNKRTQISFSGSINELESHAFRYHGFLMEHEHGQLMSNLPLLNRALLKITPLNRIHDKSRLIADYILDTFYENLPDTIKAEYPKSERMVQLFARENVVFILRKGGHISYSSIQSWIHQYFNPVK